MSTKSFIFAASISMGALSIAACDDGTAAPLQITPPPAASVSIDWQQRAGTLIAAARMSPLAAGRVYAAVSVAQHRAARAVEPASMDGAAAYDARLGAVASASVQVLSYLFPTSADSLGRMVSSTQGEFARGVALGRIHGDAIVERLKVDGFTRAWTGNVPTGPGTWSPVTTPPAGVTLGSVTPYYLQSGSQFRPAAPPAFGSAAFNADLNEVVQFTKNRTAEQLAIARGWDYAAGTTTPVGYWNKTALEMVAQFGLDDLSATRVLALMHASVFDAEIACWDAKYQYWLIRPYQASTEISMVLAAPNHPAFPSGHSCVSASAARVLQEFFPERTTELNRLVVEAGMSRIYAGIHYRFDVTAGQNLGKAVAEWAINHQTVAQTMDF
jgi:membrane-associated phospholipid phosphatase